MSRRVFVVWSYGSQNDTISDGSTGLLMNTIYLLSSPLSGKARYVGITKGTPDRRLARHIRAATSGSPHRVHAWIRALLKRGHHPIVSILEVTSDRSREVFWIAEMKSNGAPLVNSTAGGDGVANPSQWTRKKMSESGKKRLPISEETRAKLKAKSIRHSEETKAKMRKPKTPEHRAAAAYALQRARDEGRYKVLRGNDNPTRRNPESVRRGSSNVMSKLTDDAVIEMRERYGRGESTVALGAAFRVSQATAWRIVRGLSWAHLKQPAEVHSPSQQSLTFGRP